MNKKQRSGACSSHTVTRSNNTWRMSHFPSPWDIIRYPIRKIPNRPHDDMRLELNLDHHCMFLLTLHLCIILKMKPTWCTIFSVYFVKFIHNLYMFWTSPGPSPGGIAVFVRHLAFCYSVKLAIWCAGSCILYTR